MFTCTAILSFQIRKYSRRRLPSHSLSPPLPLPVLFVSFSALQLEDIEAAAGKIKAEPSIEERLAGIEAMLEKAYGRLAQRSATEGVSWAS